MVHYTISQEVLIPILYQSSSRARHRRTHMGRRPYICREPACERRHFGHLNEKRASANLYTKILPQNDPHETPTTRAPTGASDSERHREIQAPSNSFSLPLLILYKTIGISLPSNPTIATSVQRRTVSILSKTYQ